MAEMTPRERVQTALCHEEPDRVPFDIGGGNSTTLLVETYENLKRHLRISAPARIMNKAFRITIVLIAIGIAVWGFSSTYTWYFRYSKEDRALTNLTAEGLVEYPEEKRLQIKEMKTLR